MIKEENIQVQGNIDGMLGEMDNIYRKEMDEPIINADEFHENINYILNNSDYKSN